MNDKSLVKSIKSIKAELLALKQIHKYGLNRTEFSVMSISEPISNGWVNAEVVLTIDTAQATEPFIEFFLKDYLYSWFGVYSWVWDADAKTITINISYSTTLPQLGANFNIISTKPIISYTWREV